MKSLALLIVCLMAVAAFAQTPGGTNTSQASNPDDETAKPNATTTTAATTIGKTNAQTTTPTTVPTTTLPPEPKAGKWNVTGTDGTVCIMLNLGARFTFNYTDASNKIQVVTLDLPADENVTKATGECGGKNTTTSQTITLTYNQDCKMMMNFTQNNNKFYVHEIELSFKPDCFSSSKPKETITGNLVNQTLFQATVGQSYMCNAQQDLNVSTKTANSLKLEMVDVQVQAFAKGKSFDFGPAQECPQDAETSNIVPIAVGAALAALVLIVLIAYLISRNRGQRGYESV